MDATSLGIVAQFAKDAEGLGALGLALIFCVYLAYCNARDKKHCEEMVSKIAAFQSKMDEVLRSVEKQLEISNKLYAEVRQNDQEFRDRMSDKVESIHQLTTKIEAYTHSKPGSSCHLHNKSQGSRENLTADHGVYRY